MKKSSLLAASVVLASSPSLFASETVRTPAGPGGSADVSGVGAPYIGCPSKSANVMIDGVEAESGKLFFSTVRGEAWLAADDETIVRIPGVDRKESKLERLEAGKAAKIRYCTDDGKLLSVKVLRKQPS